MNMLNMAGSFKSSPKLSIQSQPASVYDSQTPYSKDSSGLQNDSDSARQFQDSLSKHRISCSGSERGNLKSHVSKQAPNALFHTTLNMHNITN